MLPYIPHDSRMTCTELRHILRQIACILPSLRIFREFVIAIRHSIFVLAYIVELRSENLEFRIMGREQSYPVYSLDCLSSNSIIIAELDQSFTKVIDTIVASLHIREECFSRMSKCYFPNIHEEFFLFRISSFLDYKSQYNRVDSRSWIKTCPADISDDLYILTGCFHTE